MQTVSFACPQLDFDFRGENQENLSHVKIDPVLGTETIDYIIAKNVQQNNHQKTFKYYSGSKWRCVTYITTASNRIQLFRERLSGKSEKVHATIPWGNLGYDQWILITRVFKYIKLVMPRPYSNDLRWRAIWMVELLGYSVDEVAATLFMSPRTIERYISKCLNTGDVNSEKLGRPFNSFAMHAHVEFVIMEAILEQPDITLAEIAYNVFEQTGSENAVSSILRYLKRNSFTRKKVCTNTNLL